MLELLLLDELGLEDEEDELDDELLEGALLELDELLGDEEDDELLLDDEGLLEDELLLDGGLLEDELLLDDMTMFLPFWTCKVLVPGKLAT